MQMIEVVKGMRKSVSFWSLEMRGWGLGDVLGRLCGKDFGSGVFGGGKFGSDRMFFIYNHFRWEFHLKLIPSGLTGKALKSKLLVVFIGFVDASFCPFRNSRLRHVIDFIFEWNCSLDFSSGSLYSNENSHRYLNTSVRLTTEWAVERRRSARTLIIPLSLSLI